MSKYYVSLIRVWMLQVWHTRVDHFYYDLTSSFCLERREYIKNLVVYANRAI